MPNQKLCSFNLHAVVNSALQSDMIVARHCFAGQISNDIAIAVIQVSQKCMFLLHLGAQWLHPHRYTSADVYIL